MQLSIEDNHINTLKDFPNLPHLMEIYLSNNCLEEIREIMNLKNLSRLIILDLSGN